MPGWRSSPSLAFPLTRAGGRPLTDKADPAKPHLVRAIGPWALGANAVNLTVGAGIFALPALVAAQLGQAAILAYLVCSVAMLLVLLCLAEAGSRVATSGGLYAYIETAFGPSAGFIASILYWFGFAITADAAVANVLIGSLKLVWPAVDGTLVRAILLAVMFGGIAWINVRGLRAGIGMVVTLTLLKLAPLLALVITGLPQIAAPDLSAATLPGFGRLATASLLLFFAFPGSEGALTPSGEIRDPARNVPLGLLGAIVVILTFYVLLQLVAQGVLGDGLAAAGERPLAMVATALWGPAGGLLLLVCASVSMLGLLCGDILASPRMLFAAAMNGMLPSALARVHPRHHTPHVAILVYALIGFLLAVSGSFAALATLASASLLFVYLGASLAVLKLRRDGVAQAGKPFLLPGGPLIPLLSAAVLVALIANTPPRELLQVALLGFIAGFWYWFRRAGGHIQPVSTE